MTPLSPKAHRSIFDTRRNVTIWSVALIFLLVAVYGYSRIQTLIAGPSIEISYPANNATVHDPILTLIGKSAHVSSITLNGLAIHTNEAGHFKEKLILPYGLSILELVATDRFNRKMTKTITLVYK